MADKSSPVDFHTFGQRLWDIANVFRDDTLKTTEYLEAFSYFLFQVVGRTGRRRGSRRMDRPLARGVAGDRIRH